MLLGSFDIDFNNTPSQVIFHHGSHHPDFFMLCSHFIQSKRTKFPTIRHYSDKAKITFWAHVVHIFTCPIQVTIIQLFNLGNSTCFADKYLVCVRAKLYVVQNTNWSHINLRIKRVSSPYGCVLEQNTTSLSAFKWGNFNEGKQFHNTPNACDRAATMAFSCGYEYTFSNWNSQSGTHLTFRALSFA